MKISIERAALLRSLAHVQSVVERRNAIPILSNVLIEASGASCGLNTTDMDISIVESTEAGVAVAGATTTSVHTLTISCASCRRARRSSWRWRKTATGSRCAPAAPASG